jgi:hypothetical protein
MHTDTGHRAGVEWVGGNEPDCEIDKHDVQPLCDAINPANRHRCIGGYHAGPHVDDTGAHWLDNGL